MSMHPTTKVRLGSRGIWWAAFLWTLSSLFPAVVNAQQLGAEFLGNIGGNATRISFAPGRPDDLFVARLSGELMRVDLTTNDVSQFANIPADNASGMSGFLGFAFAPDYQSSGNLYVHVDDDTGLDGNHHRTYVRRFGVADPNAAVASLGSPTDIIRWDQPGNDHEGGYLGFRPGEPNNLYITSGDGQNNDSNNDPGNHGQNPSTLLGTVMRVDVSGGDDFPGDPYRNYSVPIGNPFANDVGGDNAVWSYGIRSPFGASFDRQTGDFIFGDVGQVSFEEVNFERNGSAGGRNYGWRVMEGTSCNDNSGAGGNLPCGDASFTDPVYDYAHSGGFGGGGANEFEGRSITGGYVYRGPVEELQGKYVFGDWGSLQVWSLEIDRDANGGLGAVVPGSLTNLTGTFGRPQNGTFGDGVTGFGEDAAGNLYYVELDGDLYKIVDDFVPPQPPVPVPMEPLPAFRDDFDVSHNYATGNVPNGGIWDGVHNPEVGGNGFDANSSNAGQLTLGIDGGGWEGGGRDDGRFLFKEVPGENLQEIRVKISSQTQGFWSSTGIMVRTAGPLDDDASNDNFFNANSFQPDGTSAQVQNIVGGAEAEFSNDVDLADLSYLRVVHHGFGDFEMFTSPDGTMWTSQHTFSNESLATGMVEVGLWGGSFAELVGATASFDWVEIVLGVPAGDYNEDGEINLADYTSWRDTLGQNVEPYAGADGNGDGMVDILDYEIWKTNFGKTIPDLNAASLANAKVPEPTTGLMGLLATGLLWMRRVNLSPYQGFLRTRCPRTSPWYSCLFQSGTQFDRESVALP